MQEIFVYPPHVETLMRFFMRREGLNEYVGALQLSLLPKRNAFTVE